MADAMFHPTTPEIAARRKELVPHTHDAFDAFSRAVFADGALPEQTKQLIAVAVAHTTQCPYCIRGHTRLAHRKGATDEQIMGGCRDARRRCICALHPRARGTQQIGPNHLMRGDCVRPHPYRHPISTETLHINLG